MTRRLVLVAGSDPVPGEYGRSTRPVATHGRAYDYVEAGPDEFFSGYCVGKGEPNTPGRRHDRHYLVVEVVEAAEVVVSCLLGEMRPGLRCRVIEAWQWPESIPLGAEIDITPDRSAGPVDMSRTISRDHAVVVVTR